MRLSKFRAWVGTAEVIAGVALMLGGCHFSLKRDDSLSTIMYLPAFLVAVLALIIPGLLLRSRSRVGLVAQALPLSFIAWLLFVTFGGAS
jgi:hypothetical protein